MSGVVLEDRVGAWSGTNAFRLMPDDAPYEAPMTAVVVLGAGGVVTTVAYTWSHPDDGAQEGLLAVGPGAGPGQLVGLWGDTWHQAPGPTVVTGAAVDGTVTVGYEYVAGEWAWRVVLDASRPGELGMRMDNVGLESGAAAYWAMAATLRLG